MTDISLFLAKAVSAATVARFTSDQLVRYTWQRNAHIDIIEFVIDEEGALVGRALHPTDGLTFKEFQYCAYTLAVATDRLEYLIDSEDLY